MDDLGVVTPLVLLPGVALLVISTSTRYAQLHEEFHRLLVSTEPTTVDLARHLLARARFFRNALIALYTSVCLFALGSLVGAITLLWFEGSPAVVQVLTFLGIVGVVYGSFQLAREALHSMNVIGKHCREIENSQGRV